jgi:hypothetical protein
MPQKSSPNGRGDCQTRLEPGGKHTRAGGNCRQSYGRVVILLIVLSGFGFFAKQTSAQGIDASVPDMLRRQDDVPDMFRNQDQLNYNDRGHDPNEVNNGSLSSTGKPCIALRSYATAQLINKSIYEHWIKASNTCGQNIKVQVCYHKTTDCIVMNVPPWETKNAVLGIQPNLKDFQFDSKEK